MGDTGEITTLLDAMNYMGAIALLIGSMVAIAVLGRVVVDRWERAACKRRHPASLGRRARIVAQRRARLDGRGVIK